MIDPITLAVLSAISSPSAAIVGAMPAIVDDEAKALEAVEKLIADFDAAMSAFMKDYQSAETEEQRQQIVDAGLPSDVELFGPLGAIAVEHPGTEAAEKAATWVFSRSHGAVPGSSWAVTTLVNDFMHSEHIESVALNLKGLASTDVEALERIRKHGATRRIRALADYQRGNQLISLSQIARHFSDSADLDERLARRLDLVDEKLRQSLRSAGAAAALKKQGEKLLADCAANYRDIELFPGRNMIGEMAEISLFEARNLLIGCTAPDIEGVDADGVSFKLSDYRGQVVVVDFWGFW